MAWADPYVSTPPAQIDQKIHELNASLSDPQKTDAEIGSLYAWRAASGAGQPNDWGHAVAYIARARMDAPWNPDIQDQWDAVRTGWKVATFGLDSASAPGPDQIASPVALVFETRWGSYLRLLFLLGGALSFPFLAWTLWRTRRFERSSWGLLKEPTGAVAGILALVFLSITAFSAAESLSRRAALLNDVIVRASPAETSLQLAQIKAGIQVLLPGVTSNDWAQIKYLDSNGRKRTGWVTQSHLLPLSLH